jgi:hypothetical protein
MRAPAAYDPEVSPRAPRPAANRRIDVNTRGRIALCSLAFVSLSLAALFGAGPSAVAKEPPPAVPAGGPAVPVERPAAPETPTAAQILSRLRPAHPRLLATADDFAALKVLVADPKVAPAYAAVRAAADAALAAPPAKYEIRDGKRLLYVSREVKDRVLTLGLLWRLTGDRRYADRLWAEVDAVARFPDWNPRHFLDTAEMSFAMAVAYDWGHDAWSPEQRVALRAAIATLGLEPGLKVYRQPAGGFARLQHNWNQVCNGGLLTAALAVADDEPAGDRAAAGVRAAAGEVLERAVASLPLAMKHFAPDGAWAEGPGYWRYATEYNCYALAALRTAVGTDYGLSAMPGFAVTGDAPLAAAGPLGLTFNYADAGPRFEGAPQLYWLATAFARPDYAAFQNQYGKADPGPLNLLWGAAWLARDPQVGARPLAQHFRGVDVVYLRSGRDDPAALFVGFKGGDNKVNHGHLDLGSFVFDAAGQRWAMDVGPDDYNRPGYFGPNRWTFYRCRAEGNNCFVLDPGAGPDQSPKAEAPVVKFAAGGPGRGKVDWVGAVVDLSAAYAGQATSAHRGVALLNGKRLLVQDEVRATRPAAYWWFMHTEAEVAVAADGRTATLTRGGRTLTARLLSPAAGATFSVMPAASLPTSPPEPPAATRPVVGFHPGLAGVRKLTVRADAPAAADLRLAVLLDPGDGKDAPPAVVPLDQWPGAAPARP